MTCTKDGIVYQAEDDSLFASVVSCEMGVEEADISGLIKEGDKTYIVNDINHEAFKDHTNLKKVTIHDGIEVIEDEAFSGCKSLECVSLPETLRFICSEAFYQCKLLSQINIPESVKSIDSLAFAYTSLVDVCIPDSVTSIGVSAFECCEALKRVVIGDSVSNIPSNAFHGEDSLEELTIGSAVSLIGRYAFGFCSALKEVTFRGDTTCISRSAFERCKNLNKLIFENGLGGNIFMGIVGAEPNITWKYNDEEKCLYKVIEPYKYPIEVTIDGITYSCDRYKKTASTTKCDEDIKEASVVPVIEADGEIYPVVHISEHTFYEHKNLERVTLPDGVTSLDEYALSFCDSLKHVNLPSTLSTIECNVFTGDKSLESIIIPDGVKEINYGAFDGCPSLRDVVLPSTLESISGDSFIDCYALQDFYYRGSEEMADEYQLDWHPGDEIEHIVWHYDSKR